jgi:hypothetical protein
MKQDDFLFIDIEEDKWIGVLFNKKLSNIYQEEYFVKYKNPDYVNEDVRKSRKLFVERFLPIKECFDYGCGPAPLDPGGCLSAWDKYAKEYSFFDREKFNSARGLMMFDVLEHFYDPQTFLFTCKSEYVFITIPIFPGPLKCLDDLKNWKHYKPGEHIWYFTASGFKQMANESGYDVIYEGADECPPRSDIGSFVLRRK